MKRYIAGLATGIAVGAIMFNIPAIAENIDAAINMVRINADGIDRIGWQEDYTIADGSQVPGSILYKGTTYLPVRKLGELFDKKVYWNGDSMTVSFTSQPEDERVIAEKADKNGNIWEYYTFRTKRLDNSGAVQYEYFFGARDKLRSNERVYYIAGDSVRVTEEAVYFARRESRAAHMYNDPAEIIRLSFNSDKDTQDGEVIAEINATSGGNVIFDGDYVYYADFHQSNSSPHDRLVAYNYITGEKIITDMPIRTQVSELRLITSNDKKAELTFKLLNSVGEEEEAEAVFDKEAGVFS